MNAIDFERLSLAIAVTLAHFVWQGLAVWALAELVLRPHRWQAAAARYRIYAGMLVALAVLPLATFVYEYREFRPQPVRPVTSLTPQIQLRAVDRVQIHELPSAVPASPPRLVWQFVLALLATYPDRIAKLWAAGVAIGLVRLAAGAVGVMRLTHARQPLPAGWLAPTQRIATRLGFRQPPGVFVVERLSQAVAVGVIRPMVLLPAAWISELPPHVLEAVIAHELAHLRRWDLLVNLLQRLLETALFFHPVVWWCSRRLRIEREMCCDELACQASGDRLSYARSLANLAEMSLDVREPLLAAGIGAVQTSLLDRVRNILGIGQRQERHYGRLAIAGLVLASWLIAGALILKSRSTPIMPPLGSKPAPLYIPAENSMVSLPEYRIGPPDILLIEAQRLIPKAPYHLRSGDQLRVEIEGPPDPMMGLYIVDSEGRIQIGPRFGSASVRGLTADEAAVAVRKAVAEIYDESILRVTAHVHEIRGLQAVSGEHLVAQDGTVNLGIYGQVHVSGLTIPEAKAVVNNQLSKFLEDPAASVSVFSYNSKKYYVITHGGAGGDSVSAMPVTGRETVLDAVSGISGLSGKRMWISRPAGSGVGTEQVIPVYWEEIAAGGSTSKNYQLMPGDRLFIVEAPSLWNWIGW